MRHINWKLPLQFVGDSTRSNPRYIGDDPDLGAIVTFDLPLLQRHRVIGWFDRITGRLCGTEDERLENVPVPTVQPAARLWVRHQADGSAADWTSTEALKDAWLRQGYEVREFIQVNL